MRTGRIMGNKSHNKITIIIAIMIALLLTLPSALAINEVISNSANWQDVYSTILYGNLAGASSRFLTSTPHGPILLYEISKDSESVQIITSADKPFYIGYEALMESKGYKNVEELIFSRSNLELAKRLPNIQNYIVLDGAYGYNALAVAPYAVKAKHYVLFANNRNIDEIEAFLNTKKVENVIIYGRVDREVRNALSRYNPEILNSDTGSRFENNMLIVDKFSELGSIKQVILSNGEFIEASMMSGNEAVLFIGKNSVPQETKEYISKKGIEIGVLIGNELIGSATDIRRQVGISVFVKFARGSRIPGGTINPVEDLDRFPMPSYQLSMSLVSIAYNKATGQLEATYKNNVEMASFFKSTITIKNSNGETIAVTGDEGIQFIDGEETKTVVYKINISATQNLESLSGEVYTIYGESKTSLENVIRGTFKIDIISVMDDAEIEIVDLKYDKSSGKFYITIENTGTVDAYVSGEIFDLWINGEYVTVASNTIEKIGVGKSKDIVVEIDMDDEDLSDKKNSEINVLANYGERKHALIKAKTGKFKLKYREGTSSYFFIIIIVVIIAILLFFLLGKRKKKECPRCRTKNDKDAGHCKKCGHQF